jgi:hypothetical protein
MSGAAGRAAGGVRAACAVGALLGGCASPAPVVRRGVDRDAIHAALAAVAMAEGYRCAASPDLRWQTCRHDDLADLGFAYLPASNLLQLWSIFSRDDPGLHPRWRAAACASVDGELARINAETIVKVVCDERTLRFEMSTWIPSCGLPAEDVRAWFAVFREIVAETIVVRGFLPDVAPVVAAPVVARRARRTDPR